MRRLVRKPYNRNKEAKVQLKVIFGSGWKDKAQTIYNVYHRLFANLPGGFMYDCITGMRQRRQGDKETEWANAWVGGGSKGDVNVCYENLRTRGLKWFAHVVIHELGHLILSLEHGSDDVSGTCAQETDDAECYGLLAEELWRLVDPEYSKSNVDLCLSGANGRTQDPSNWD